MPRNASHTSPTVPFAASAARIGTSTLAVPVQLALVSPGAQRGQPLGLLGLDRRVDPERLVGVLDLDAEPVQAHDGPLAAVDLGGDLVGRLLDLALLEAGLDRGHGAT